MEYSASKFNYKENMNDTLANWRFGCRYGDETLD